MPDIFLSYNRGDQATARRFAEGFEAAGFEVWWDVSLRSGEAYDQVTEEALRTAKAVVVLWSMASVASRWVRAEATLALRQKTLLPVMIEPCERPIMFELIQTADLSHWTGDPNDEAWRTFLADVRRFLAHGDDPQSGAGEGSRPAASPPAPPPPRRPIQNRRSLAVVAAVALVTMIGVALWLGFGPLMAARAPSLRAVALLPVTNLTGDHELDAQVDQLTQDTINTLSRSGSLIVSPWLSVEPFKGRRLDPRQSGKSLGVRTLVFASLSRSGATYRVNLQIIDAETLRPIHSTEVTQMAANGQFPEARMAASLFVATYGPLTERWMDAKRAAPPNDKDPESVTARLAGLDSDPKVEDVPKGDHLIALGRQVVPASDPLRQVFDDIACEVYLDWLSAHLERQPDDRAKWATGALDFGAEAARLKPEATTPHVCRANAFAALDRWDEAEAEAKHIIDMSPTTVVGYSALGDVEFARGRFEDAVSAYAEVAARSLGDRTGLAFTETFLGLTKAAIPDLREAIVRNPDDPTAPLLLTAALQMAGRHDEAVAQGRAFNQMRNRDTAWPVLIQSREPAFVSAADKVRAALHDAGLTPPRR